MITEKYNQVLKNFFSNLLEKNDYYIASFGVFGMNVM